MIKDLLTAPLKITIRITLGVAGFALMGGGLLIMDLLHSKAVGIPVFLVGLLLLVKSIF